MSHPSLQGLAALLLVASVSTSASAQLSARGTQGRVPGEDYVVEAGGFFWNPTPEAAVRTETYNIIGTTIDLADDLGVVKKRLPELRLVLKAAAKHKFRIGYVPIDYSSEAVLVRTIVFNGTTYRVGLPVNSTFKWRTWRFGYEYDFIKRERGYVGVIAEVKYTDVQLGLVSLALTEQTTAQIPVPTIGGTFRVYPAPFLSVTGEVTGVKLPGSLTQGDDTAHYIDWQLYATANFSRHVGAQAGYRTVEVSYRHKDEFGDFTLKGPYIGAVVRF